MLYKVPFPWDRHLGGICPPFSLGSYRGEGSLAADWLDLVVALVTPILCPCRSCRGQPTFSKTAVGGFLSSAPGSGLPRWNRQPAAGTAGPPGRAGLLIPEPWRLLGCQPTSSPALGMPHKSSPRQHKFQGGSTPARGCQPGQAWDRCNSRWPEEFRVAWPRSRQPPDQARNPGTSMEIVKTSARRRTRRSPMLTHETSLVSRASVMGMTYRACHAPSYLSAGILGVSMARR
jgi:hypothetical protein